MYKRQATYEILPLNIYGTSMSLTGIYKRGDSIDITPLPKGLYLIRVQTESGKILTKKIKL
ncbi:MAG: T9SS type A sorting domain-containing protein [Muribaculaceae bacterium]|nr:T9SS type A sorting domain-containing protein [Muribaculaceae bacterium]